MKSVEETQKMRLLVMLCVERSELEKKGVMNVSC